MGREWGANRANEEMVGHVLLDHGAVEGHASQPVLLCVFLERFANFDAPEHRSGGRTADVPFSRR